MYVTDSVVSVILLKFYVCMYQLGHMQIRHIVTVLSFIKVAQYCSKDIPSY